MKEYITKELLELIIGAGWRKQGEAYWHAVEDGE